MTMALHVLHVPGADPHRDEVVAHLKSVADVCVHADPERTGIVPNWLGALDCAAANDTALWSVILQDDAMPFKGWESELAAAQRYSPEPALGLTYFGKVGESAFRRGIPYLVGPHLIWGGAVTFRRDFLSGLAGWARRVYEETGYLHDDRMVSAYAQRQGHRTALTVRAIFDQPVQASLVGHAAMAQRRPSVSIEKAGGAPFSAVPRSAVRSTGGAPDQREWLARYGTANPTPYSFEVHRRGAVRRVEEASTARWEDGDDGK